ncbi:beta-lactamase/transpeptidase-like protein [Podospora aff. communis PSN243]|uniref:Beta-lactamase/transpeptidase-like protein n=1 Tax=Podospora aff. communis PSN243 TaxID=3040156 RepID=A0AAV9G967_9PEZI|nr:beta-lactamase/transpeptidase-like protein [Podospora aff. communis PSN243]
MENSAPNLSPLESATTTTEWFKSSRRLRPLFCDVAEQLCAKYGTVGLSAGMLDNGEYCHFNVGSLDHPDDPNPRESTQHSMYLVSSLTKPIFALAIAIMVNDQQYGVDFTTEVEDILPEMGPRGFLNYAGRKLTLVDLLDNRTEFPRCTNLWESPNGVIPWKGSEPLFSVLCHVPRNPKFTTPASFRHARNYSNEGFALAAAILEKKTGMPWAKFVQQRVLEPLGMHNTIAGKTGRDAEDYAEHLARSFSASIDEHLETIQSWVPGDTKEVEFKQIFRYVRDELCAIKPVEVAASQVSHASDDQGSSTLMGAAAGILSSVSDLLKFYAKFVDVYHLPEHQKLATNSCSLSEVERGMLTVQKHIWDMVDNDKTCAYAAGWSTTMVPWNPDSSPRPRWPGEDGDNARWMNKPTENGDDDCTPPEWPFFRRRDARREQRLVLNHGGNMIGATSFCLVDLERKRAVVVLTNTRGYMVDCANFVGMLMATKGDPEFEENCAAVMHLACFAAAKYLQAVHQYEEDLKQMYPSWPIPVSFKDCLGTYELTDGGILATISERKSDGRLVFELHGTEYAYPLRLRKGTGSITKMTIATSMTELLPTGVGGNNRLELRGFEIEFQDDFKEFVWDFSMTDLTAKDIRKQYTFRRVSGGQ